MTRICMPGLGISYDHTVTRDHLDRHVLTSGLAPIRRASVTGGSECWEAPITVLTADAAAMAA